MIECFVEGNVGKNPEAVNGKSGTFVKFSVASSNGKDQPPTWVDIAVFSTSLIDQAMKVEKGNKVRVFGRLKINEVNGKTFLNVTADSIRILYAPKNNTQGQSDTFNGEAMSKEPMNLEDIPF